MKGYKVFNPDWTCRGFQYAVGETFEENVIPLYCKRGFHFCTELKDCFKYYRFDPDNKVAEVEALGDINIEPNTSKCCTNKIKIVRELSWEEALKMINIGKANTGRCNTGDYNSGDNNSGDYNAGYGNSGDYNSGDYNTGIYNSGDHNVGHSNTGNWNIGTYNSGNFNSGDCNYGNWNSGNCNSGDYNSGDWNISNFSNGCFNTKESKILMFNKPSNWTIRDWYHSKAMIILDRLHNNSLQWIPAIKMSREEKEQHPEYEITGGYLKKCDKSECNQLWWDSLSDPEKNIIKSLPNFDAEIFKEITGIDINKGV